MIHEKISFSSDQSGMLEKLSPRKIDSIQRIAKEASRILRRCILAVLATGEKTDEFSKIREKYPDFGCEIRHDGDFLIVDLFNFPEDILVDGEIMGSVKNLILSVIRDVTYSRKKLAEHCELNEPVSELVFDFVKSAKIIEEGKRTPDRVVCFGGHSISEEEYDYTKEIGYQLGLRRIEITTGCGVGAMKGPMKGATIGYRKLPKEEQNDFDFIGMTELEIIMAEAPNPIVSKLLTLPNIEMRLEAFVRTNHTAVFFPGGTGTMEELMYLLAVLIQPENKDRDFPIVLTAHGESGAKYWKQIHEFVGKVFGAEAQSKYTIVIDVENEDEEKEENGIFYIQHAPKIIASDIKDEITKLRQKRKENGEARHFNWSFEISTELQKKFDPTHENVRNLRVSPEQKTFERLVEFRKIFSTIVAGNVKPDGIAAVAEKGKYQINIDKKYTVPLAELLSSFVAENRMKISKIYEPCFEIC